VKGERSKGGDACIVRYPQGPRASSARCFKSSHLRLPLSTAGQQQLLYRVRRRPASFFREELQKIAAICAAATSSSEGFQSEK
jgi:hypothetical protein